MNYCPKCRKKLVVQDFCIECGTDLKNYINDTDKKDTNNNVGGFQGIDFSIFENEAKRQLEEQQRLEKERAEELKRLEEQKRREEQKRAEEQKRFEEQTRLEEQKRREEQKRVEEQKRIEKQKRLEKLKAEEREEEKRKDKIYKSAQDKMRGALLIESTSFYEEAIQLFESISGWRDSKDQIKICREQISAIKLKETVKYAQDKRKQTVALVAFLILFAVFIFVYINNLLQIDEFGKVFENCWIEYGLLALCLIPSGIYSSLVYRHTSELGTFTLLIMFLLPVALIILAAIFIDTNFILRIIILIIRLVPEFIIGAIALFGSMILTPNSF